MNLQLPAPLIQSLEAVKGFDKLAFEEVHHHQNPVTSIRFNPAKFEYFGHEKIMHPSFKASEPVAWCRYGAYLEERPQFTFDPLFHAGAYYVQEASSMFLWEILKQNFKSESTIKVLDLCAAPGGKSTLLVSYFKNALIVSNEVIKARANILYENITKWGAENIVVTNNDAKDFDRLKNYFDIIVVDAPCSGSGLFRKDALAINEWSLKNVELCCQRQKRILADIYGSLKNNGILIYSTCSYSTEENEETLDWLKDNFNAESIKLTTDECWNIEETISEKHKAYGYRFWPYKLKGEGFFIAAVQKKEGGIPPKINNLKLSIAATKEINICKEFTLNGDFIFFKQNEIIRLIHKQWLNDIALLQKNFYLKKAGIQCGEIKGNSLIPHHELAMSTLINKNIFKIKLTAEEALQYLRKKEIFIYTTQKNRVLCTYNSFPLGWAKILHNRVNNYYPTEWRIRKE